MSIEVASIGVLLSIVRTVATLSRIVFAGPDEPAPEGDYSDRTLFEQVVSRGLCCSK